VVRCASGPRAGGGAVSPAGPNDAVGATVAIVPVAEHHAEGFHACLDVVARERRYLAQVEAPPLERIEAFVRESVANDAAQFMAVDGDRVVGWADILPAWAHAVAHVGSLGMGVLPAYRGRGIGRRLLGACIAKARAQGITRIELEVRADNERAIALYRALGFEQEAVKRHAMRFDGEYHDALLMSLLKDAR
jgi:ribosomal protein S18 acetylase RimI-like enzyme